MIKKFIALMLISTTCFSGKIAPWYLQVRFNSSIYPQEHYRWDALYGPFDLDWKCTDYAKEMWKNYINYYKEEIGSFSTFCYANGVHTKYMAIVTCDRSLNCFINKIQ